MGYGGYSHEAHQQITQHQATLPPGETFKETCVRDDMCVYNMRPRESRDSAKHPASLAIAFFLDGTQSMHDIPFNLATRTLPAFMATVIGLGIHHPQILFGMVGDTETDMPRPIQVGQFESEEGPMNSWLLRYPRKLFKGGANAGESYHLCFPFLAQRTSIDCFEKRGKRGYAFLTGDDHPFRFSGPSEITNVFGDIHEKARPVRELLQEAQRMYHVFFVIPDQFRASGCGFVHDRGTVESSWRELLGDHVIVAEDPDDVCTICGALVALTEGTVKTLDALADRLRALGTDSRQLGRIMNAIGPYANAIGRGDRPPAGTPPADDRSAGAPRERRQRRDAY